MFAYLCYLQYIYSYKLTTYLIRVAGTGGAVCVLGGGGLGELAPTTWKLWGHRPLTLDWQCFSFVFVLVFARELGSLQKNTGPKQGVFSFG